ncbi:MAG: hypothetical protein KC544_04230 [Gemmatimonadetes bacterium]|nr:hypothetical protein [Gemmatimonadota bacterium]
MIAWRWAALLVATACGAPPTPEQLADRAAADGRWEEALAALSQAEPTAGVLARRAEAALQSGNLRTAAVDFTRLASADASRRGEAASGLTRTAQAAGRTGDGLALTTALLGLRDVAPGWPLGRLALNVRLGDEAPPDEVLRLAPAILASSPGRDVGDRVLLALAEAVLAEGDCSRAVPVLTAVETRADPALAAVAGGLRAGCLLAEGMAALAAGDTLAARRALDATVALDPSGAAGRRALVALGDVYLGEGDPFAAQVAWRTAAAAAQSDTITALALERLRSMAGPGATGEPEIP